MSKQPRWTFNDHGWINGSGIVIIFVLSFFNPPLAALGAGIVCMAVAYVCVYMAKRYGPDD